MDQHPGSQLFTLRLWPEQVAGAQTQWRGKVQHVRSGEVRYFQDWPALVALLPLMLESPGAITAPADAAPPGDATAE